MIKCVLELFLPSGGDYHKELRYNCIVQFEKMYVGLVQPWAGGEYVAACGRKALVLYAELQNEALCSKHFQKTGVLLYRLYPKMHGLLHVLEDQVKISGNPRDNWCYADESEIGAAVCVAESMHPSKLHRGVMKKHRLL